MPAILFSRRVVLMLVLISVLMGMMTERAAGVEGGVILVNLEPPEAVAAGARWRRVGTTVWRNSGTSETGRLGAYETVEFSGTRGGWAIPAPQKVRIYDYTFTQVQATYTPSRADLSWSTYLGGSAGDVGSSIALDSAGNIYLTGATSSSGWISSGGDVEFNGDVDAFVASLKGSGEFRWSTYLGGAALDKGNGIAVTPSDHIQVVGNTASAGWIPGSTAYNGGSQDGFILKLNSAGTVLSGAYLGGNQTDSANGVTIDNLGNCCIAGYTESAGWLAGGNDTDYGGAGDGYMIKLPSTGQPLWGTYLGGGQRDEATAVGADGTGNCYITGFTSSNGWVTGGYDTTMSGESYNWQDAFLTKLTAGGKHAWSTFMGGPSQEWGRGIAVDAQGNCLAVGRTLSSGWVWDGYNTTYAPVYFGSYGYAVLLSSAGSHIWSTYLGRGGYEDEAFGAAMDGKGGLYVTGKTDTAGWVSNDINNYLGGLDAYIIKLSWGGGHLWSTYLGDTGADAGCGIVADHQGNIFATGYTYSSGWAVGGFDTVHNGGSDSFVARLHDTGRPEPAGSLGVTITPAQAVAAGAQWRRVGETAWHGSSVTVVGIPAGACQIEFKPLPYWTAPAPQNLTITTSTTTSAAGEYEQFAQLRVSLTPAETVAVGARWRRHGTATWLDSGTIEAGLATGPVLVEFKPVAGWITPTSQTVNLVLGQTADLNINYLMVPTALTWAGQVGSAYADFGSGMAIDNAGNFYLAGYTAGGGWASGGYDTNYDGGAYDGFVTKIKASGEQAWSTFLGGAKEDRVNGIALDPTGNVLVTGQTQSGGWASGGYDTEFGGTSLYAMNAFAAKLSGTGQHLWSTYLGGSGNEIGYGLAADQGGNVFVVGSTTCADWVSGGFDSTFGGTMDGFVARLSPAGAHLWSAYIGAWNNNDARGVVVDSQGNACVVGNTMYEPLNIDGASAEPIGQQDAYAFKLTPDGHCLWVAMIGGTGKEEACAVTSDHAGNFLLTGSTSSKTWVAGGYDTTQNGGDDPFLVKLSPGGRQLWSTFMGGGFNEWSYSVCTDQWDNVYVTGMALQTNWVTTGFSPRYNGGPGDAFVVKCSPSGNHLWSSFLGGIAHDLGRGIAVDGSGNLWVSGWTGYAGWMPAGSSLGFPGGSYDAFLARIRQSPGLMVVIGPSAVVNAGARWRRVGTSAWRESGEAELGVNSGNHVIEFKPVSTWKTPAQINVTLNECQSAELRANYVAPSGVAGWSAWP